jgi:hypothetical protein
MHNLGQKFTDWQTGKHIHNWTIMFQIVWNDKHLKQILYYNPKWRKDLEDMDRLIKKTSN